MRGVCILAARLIVDLPCPGWGLGLPSAVNMQMSGLMGLERPLRSSCVIIQRQIKAQCVGGWSALQLDIVPGWTSLKHHGRGKTQTRARQKMGREEEQMVMAARGCLDNVGGEVGGNQFCMIFFIDMHPGEVNAITACPIDVCLVDD